MHPKHLIVEAPERLREVMAHAGYRVQLHVERANGGELDAYHQSCIPAIVAGYQADERRPEATAAEVDTMALLDELIAQEEGADPSEPKTAPPADPLPRAS
jgi:hypothetical protein